MQVRATMFGVLAALLLSAGSDLHAAPAAGGNSAAAKACAEDGWRSWFTRDGKPFKNAGECTSYAAKGGVHIPAEALQCLADGWKGLYDVKGAKFATEDACVKHLRDGGDLLSGKALECLGDGWKARWKSTDGAAFAAQQDCVTYSVGGGTFLTIDPRCGGDGYTWLKKQDGAGFTDERQCSVYTAGGGVPAGIKVKVNSVSAGMVNYTVVATGMKPYVATCGSFGCGGRLEVYVGRKGVSYSTGYAPIATDGTVNITRQLWCSGVGYVTANGHTKDGKQITAASAPVAGCP